MSQPAIVVAVMLLALIGGCDRADERTASPPDQSAPNAAQRRAASAEEVDRLRALPYAGYAEIEEGMEEDGVVTHDRRRSYPGYNLYIIRDLRRAELIDADGGLVHAWEYPTGRLWGNGEILANGDFLVTGADDSTLPSGQIADDSRYLLRLDWNSNVVWKRRLTAHHDVEVTPRGQILTLTFQRRRIPRVHQKLPVRDDLLTLLTPDGKLLESLSLFDILTEKPKQFAITSALVSTSGGPPWVDMFHSNSIEWMRHKHLAARHPIYDPANVLVCLRHQDRVAIINWDRHELIWAWGQHELSSPHDAHTLSNGNILIFDNGLRSGRSRVIEMNPLTRKIVWRYQAPNPTDFYTYNQGSCQRLPNGNTLITDSDSGQVFEVTPAGEIVWEFRCPHRNDKGERAAIVRTKRLEPVFVESLLRQFDHHDEQPTP